MLLGGSGMVGLVSIIRLVCCGIVFICVKFSGIVCMLWFFSWVMKVFRLVLAWLFG